MSVDEARYTVRDIENLLNFVWFYRETLARLVNGELDWHRDLRGGERDGFSQRGLVKSEYFPNPRHGFRRTKPTHLCEVLLRWVTYAPEAMSVTSSKNGELVKYRRVDTLT